MLRTVLLVLVFFVLLVLLQLLDIAAHVADPLNEVHVVSHDLQIVSLVDLALNLKALLKGVHGVFKELSLVLVLLFNVGVDVSILGFLILHEVEQALVDGDLQLLVVIRVLDHLVNGILEVVDDGVVVADDVAVRLDCFLDEALTDAKIFDHEAETGVDLVVLLEALVHGASAGSEVGDFELFRGNVLTQVPDLLIQHKLELFKLLSLLFEVKDVLLSCVDDLILLLDFGLFVRPLQVELLDVFLLLFKLDALVVDPSGQRLDVRLNIGQLVFGDLEVSFGAKTHVSDLIETGLVLLFNFTDL